MWHHRLLSALSLICLLSTPAQASENLLTTVALPLDIPGRGIQICRLPCVTGSGYTTETYYLAIAFPYIPQSAKGVAVGDINVVSRAGIALTTKVTWSPTNPNVAEERILIFDFIQAKPELLSEPVIKAMLECVTKTGLPKNLRSRVLHAEKYPAFVKLIEAAIPPKERPGRFFTVYQPIDSNDVEAPEISPEALLYVAPDGNPETLIAAIAQPHKPLQSTPHAAEDINRASMAGILLSCESHGKGDYTVVFDLTKLDKNWIDDRVITAVLKCVEKTVPSKKFHSRILGGDPYPQYVKLIEARMPKETTAAKSGGN